jgi:hypothetical protein
MDEIPSTTVSSAAALRSSRQELVLLETCDAADRRQNRPAMESP